MKKIKGLKLNIRLTLITLLFTVVPIAVLAGVLFYNMEQSVIEENLNNMNYMMERNEVSIQNAIDSANMSTQFFLSDDGLLLMLNTAAEGGSLSASDMVDLRKSDIEPLERLVNNNPLLYSVRIYSAGNTVQEIMPIIYKNSRMNKLSFYSDENLEGWHFDYFDTTFGTKVKNDVPLAGLITPVNDFLNGKIGYVEAAIPMSTLFPGLYDGALNEWSFYLSDDGREFYGTSIESFAKANVSKSSASKAFQAMLLDDESGEYRAPLEMVSEIIPESDKKSVAFYKDKKTGARLVVSSLPMKGIGGRLIRVVDISDEIQQVYNSRNLFIGVVIVILVAVTFAINSMVNNVLHQLYITMETMRNVREGNLEARVEIVERGDEDIRALGFGLNRMLDRIKELNQENIDREVLVKHSELKALQNQINAHFIYNVLENIKMMAEIDEEYEISDAITALGKLLRYSMRWVKGNVRVMDELDYIKNYVVLINLRFDYEIILSINIPEEMMEMEIPKMSIQPLVENAIIHGIEEVAEDTTVYIKGIIGPEVCRIEITDSGKGMTEQELKKLRDKIEKGLETTEAKSSGIGLKNVQDRIRLAFGEEFGLAVDSLEGCYTKVSLSFPSTKEEKTGSIEEKAKNIG